MHLAISGRGGERHGVEVVEHDLPPARRAVRPVPIRAQARRGELAQLVEGRCRAATLRVAVLLELDGERAPAFGPNRKSHASGHVKSAGLSQPAPVDGRIAAGAGRVGQLAILQEEQRADDQGWNVVEAGKQRVLWPSVVDRLAPEVADDQSRHHGLAIRWRHAPSHEAHHACALAGLLGHGVPGGLEPPSEVAEAWIASLRIEGAAPRKGDAGARPSLDLVRETRGITREQPGLYRRGAELVVDEGGEAAEDQHDHGEDLWPARRAMGWRVQAARRYDLVHTPT